jgi:hypothetical protein
MNKNTLGSEAFKDREPVNPLAPVTQGLAAIEDHKRFWLTDDYEFATPEALAALRRATDQVVILDGLPEHVEVDPDPHAPVHRYPPLRSEMPLPSLNEVLDLIRSTYGQPHNPNQA